MSIFESEEKRRSTTYDWKILKWLFGFVKKYGRYFALSLLLMVFTALLEVAVPYLTKKAVDSYIYPNWGEIELNKNSAATTHLLNLKKKNKEKLIELDKNRYLINLSNLNISDKNDLEKYGLLSSTNYIVINPEKYSPDKKSKLLNIFNEKQDYFLTLNNLYITTYDNLNNFNKNELKILRLEQIQNLKRLILYIFLCLIGTYLFTTSFTYLLYYSGHRIMHLIRMMAFNKILKLPQKYFDKNPVGRITTRVTNDVNAINEMYTSVLVQFIKDMIVIVAILVILFNMNPKLTLIIIVLTLFLGMVVALFRMRLKTAFREIRITIGKLNAFVQESIRGIVLLKLYGKEKDNYGIFEKINRENYKANMDQLWTYAMFRPFIEYVSIMGTGLIIWYGGLSVINLNFTLGSLIAFLYYVRMIFRPIQEISEKYNIFQSAAAASENLFDIIEETEEDNGNYVPEKTRGVLEFKNVWFSYNNKDWVLKNVSFKIRPGEIAALVGLTGSGKSTIVNLILKFYKIQRGEILFNGINIDQLSNKYLRENITAVFQDLFLFDKDISEEQIDQDEIREKYGIGRIGKEKHRLSSGENQVISLSKAFDKKSHFLIMDEATSHIDAEIERKIQNKIVEDTKSQTKLIIAHRLSNVKNADKIMVMHKGEIVEQGKHKELLENKKIYFTLHNLQKELQKFTPSYN